MGESRQRVPKRPAGGIWVWRGRDMHHGGVLPRRSPRRITV